MDESGLLMSPIVRRTWAPSGKTPCIKHKTRSHKKISAIGAIAVGVNGRNPRQMFRLLEDQNVDTTLCVQFLVQLKQNIKGSIIVIWDRLQAHRSKRVKEWLKRNHRIELEYFPPYAPELNPVEYLWAYLKHHILVNFSAETLTELYRESKKGLCKIRHSKTLLSSFVHHSPANFFD